MCGIVGYSGVCPPGILEESLRLIAHRGPDDSGIFKDEAAQVGLGHTRLSIIDLSPLGHQPMFSPDKRVALVFNGEIYNYRELRAELEQQGVLFVSHSDTEVLLQLYLRYGENMLERLNGIFAFAFWDAEQQRLFIARDRFGVKPLYIAQSANGVAFASEIKALMPLMPGPLQIDEQSIDRYLNYLWCPGEGTPVKAIRKLLPGQAMYVHAGKVDRQWTWSQLPTVHAPKQNMTENEAVQGTLTHLRQAVQRQMVADVPVGAFLSGGLDSSAIVALAREQVPNIQCFTIEAQGKLDDGAVDDLPYARQVAKHLGVALHVVQINADSMAADLEQMVWQLDEPLADPACLNVLYISQLARRNGIKVLLSGSGGDDLFSGYRRHLALNYEHLWQWLPLNVRQGMSNAANRLDQRKAFGRRVSRALAAATFDGDARTASYFSWAARDDLLPLYSADFKSALVQATEKPILDFLSEIPQSVSKLDRMLAVEQRFFLADHNLIYTDKMSMACGVEARVPFLDNDLVEFAAKIPSQFKQRGSISKWVLKKAMEPYLPHGVIYRPKTGFGAPLRRWMLHDLRDTLGEVLSESSISKRGLFDAMAVQKLLAENDRGLKDASYTLFSLMCIEIWCRKFIDSGKTLKQVPIEPSQEVNNETNSAKY